MRAKGQILIIVMVLMAIIAVIIVSITNTMITNTQNTAEDSRFATIYSFAEDLSIQFGRAFGNPAKISILSEAEETSIESFLTTVGYRLKEVNGSKCDYGVPRPADDPKYTCTVCNIERIPLIEESDAVSTDATIEGILSVCDTPFIDNAEVAKDEILIFDLEGVADNITRSGAYTISVDNTSLASGAKLALEVAIDFTFRDTVTGKIDIATAKTLINYRNSNLFPASGANNAYTDPDNTRYVVIPSPTTQDNKVLYTFNINSGANSFINRVQDSGDTSYISHLYPEGNTIQVVRINQIRLKPYMEATASESKVKLGISTTNSNINITQGRRVEANLVEKSILTGEIIGSQAIVVSTVPAVKYPTLFDYVLKTNTIE